MTEPAEMHWVGFGGKTRSGPAVWNLGVTMRPLHGPQFGLRRAFWDAAYGYVNGFPVVDVLYFVATRSLSRAVWHRVFHWEYPHAVCPVSVRRRGKCRRTSPDGRETDNGRVPL